MIDVYCERIGPGLLAEPLNALTNASYLIAAWAAWLLASRLGRPSAGVWVLLMLSVAVGIGSGLWHTFATPWAFVLDIVPIVLFLVWFFWLYLRSVAELPTPFAAAVIVAFLLTTYFAQSFADVLHGALAYTPALILLLVPGGVPRSAFGGRPLLAAGGRRRFRDCARLPHARSGSLPRVPHRHTFPLAQPSRTGRVPGNALLDPQPSVAGWAPSRGQVSARLTEPRTVSRPADRAQSFILGVYRCGR
jgi:hypothetical protein